MNPAIIRLAKKLVLASSTSHAELKELWSGINQNIETINARRSSKLNWKEIHSRNKEELIAEATEFGEFIRKTLQSKLPEEANMSLIEKSLQIESSRTEIADFTSEPGSLILHYSLITERLTLIDHIGNQLLLAKEDAAGELVKGSTIQNTFCLDISKGYEIIQYSRLEFTS